MNPVNVIPHETQFKLLEETDPDKEERVQAAISSFFKEQQIVPSPRVVGQSTTAVASTSAAIFSVNQIRTEKRDMTTQTALSFPPNLPREIEDLLMQYQLTDECNTNDEGENDRSMMDISTLRRKLFILPETPERGEPLAHENFAIDLNLSPAPRTPELNEFSRHSLQLKFASAGSSALVTSDKINADDAKGQLIQEIDGDLFGELSPIGKFDSSSPNSSLIMSSSTHDISMASDFGTQEQTPTGSRLRCNKLKKKRLSDSFSMLNNEDSLCDKENNFEFHSVLSGGGGAGGKSSGVLFYRCDSGFREDSNQMMNLSTEFMQI